MSAMSANASVASSMASSHSRVPTDSPIRISSASYREASKAPPQKLATKIIRNPFFEFMMAVIILLNFVIIIAEADATAAKADDKSPDAPAWIEVSSWTTLIVFIMELLLRIFADGLHFWHDGWNVFDAIVIGLDAVGSVLELIIGSVIPVSALRVLRLCKLARVSKIFRIFPELRLMMAGLIGSMRSIFWGMILLLFAVLVWAIVGVQFMQPVNLRVVETGVYTRMNCERCPEAYETVARATITILQQSVAGDAWGLMTIPIIEEQPAAALYFLGVMMTISLAVMNLILGVVVNVAMESRDDLAEQMRKETILARVDAEKNLTQVCADMDSDGSGQLSKDELMTGYVQNDMFRDTLMELGIAEEDLDILWTILDPDRDGQVPYTTFIHKSYSLKESDTQFMLAYIKYYVTRIRDQILHNQEQSKELLLKVTGEVLEKDNEIEGVLEEKMNYEKKHVDNSGIRFEASQGDLAPGGSEGAGPVRSSLRLSSDDRRVLDDILEKSRQWREEINVSIMGVNSRLDAFLQDPAWTDLPRKAPVTRKLCSPCFQSKADQAVDFDVPFAEDVVEPPQYTPGEPSPGRSWPSSARSQPTPKVDLNKV